MKTARQISDDSMEPWTTQRNGATHAEVAVDMAQRDALEWAVEQIDAATNLDTARFAIAQALAMVGQPTLL